jgi:hypothetical protein
MLPLVRPDETGPATVVTAVDQQLTESLWWDAMTAPAAWDGQRAASQRKQQSHYAAPFPIGPVTRVEAEDFDHGGEGHAYHKIHAERIPNSYRDTGVRIMEAGDAKGGYNKGAGDGFCVAGMRDGEWLEYALDVRKEGTYEIGARVASAGEGGRLRLLFDGKAARGEILVPGTDGETRWTTVPGGGVELRAGRQQMRVAFIGAPVSVNYLTIVPRM